MKDLIERLEKATGPSRDLDAAIYCVDRRIILERSPKEALWLHMPGGESFVVPWDEVPLFTSSLDVAMTLAKPKSPSDWPWVTLATVNPNSPRGCVAQIWLSSDRKFTGKGATIELALTACALKALHSRSVEEPKDG